MTRSPISALVMIVPAPIEQSRPIRTSAPITAFAPIMVPLPISARGPTTAPGSIVTPSSIRALGSTCAPVKSPGPDSEDGRSACGNNSRATVTKARYGSRTVKHRDPRRQFLGERRGGKAGPGMCRGRAAA